MPPPAPPANKGRCYTKKVNRRTDENITSRPAAMPECPWVSHIRQGQIRIHRPHRRNRHFWVGIRKNWTSKSLILVCRWCGIRRVYAGVGVRSSVLGGGELWSVVTEEASNVSLNEPKEVAMTSQLTLMGGYAFWTEKNIAPAATTEPKQTEKRKAGWCDPRFKLCNRTEVQPKKSDKSALGGKNTTKGPSALSSHHGTRTRGQPASRSAHATFPRFGIAALWCRGPGAWVWCARVCLIF